jgi:hypothetical protein
MEETGCDEGQAIVALESCNYDIAKSISKIFDVLRDIVVLKGKFRTFENHLFGMLTITADINRRDLLRTKVLVTYNPKVYETDISQNWYEYEKMLYTARLISGSIPDITLNIENVIMNELGGEYKGSFFSAIEDDNRTEIVDILEDILTRLIKTSSIDFDISSERLNMTQFRKISNHGQQMQTEFNFVNYKLNLSEPLSMEVKPLFTGKDGVRASLLSPGDDIFVYISDKRDIARYISGLLGGRMPAGDVAIPCKIQETARKNKEVEITVRLAIGVVGKAVVPERSLVKALSAVGREGLVKYALYNFYLIFVKFFEKIVQIGRSR